MPKASPFFSLVLIGPCGWLDSFFLHISPKDAYGVEMSVFPGWRETVLSSGYTSREDENENSRKETASNAVKL